jgi:hypothetical protein
MARGGGLDLTQAIGLGALGVVGLVAAQQGIFGAGAQAWANRYSPFKKAGLPGGGTGGGTQQQPQPQQPQPQQPGPAPAPVAPAAPVDPVAAFVAQYGLDPSDTTAQWVRYYRDSGASFGDLGPHNWPADDLRSGHIAPFDLYVYAINAIGFLTGGPAVLLPNATT